MYTSVWLVALASISFPAQQEESSLNWRTDYLAACEKGQEAGKPVAIFFGSGPRGWQQVVRSGNLSAESVDLLQSEYVPVYINTAGKDGKKWAEQFELPGGVGLVISDQGCTVQAFHHAGQLSNEDLQRYLRRYADSGHRVQTTETAATRRVSYYPPTSAVTPAYSAPVVPQYYQPAVPVYYGGYGGFGGFGGFGGGGGGFGGGFGGGGGC